MSESVRPVGEPIQLRAGANSYCRYCNTWGNAHIDIDGQFLNYCQNCHMSDFLIPNPFPDNLVPYCVLPPKKAREK